MMNLNRRVAATVVFVACLMGFPGALPAQVSADQISSALSTLTPDQAASLANSPALRGKSPAEIAELAQKAAAGAQGAAPEQTSKTGSENLVKAPEAEPLPVVTLYPGSAPLPLFGYDLFAGRPSTFAPASDIPVPVDYVVGPGDTLQVLLIGDRGGFFTLPVTRQGEVNLPQIGPLPVAGLKFADVKSLIEERVAAQTAGSRASVTLGQLRSIQVFVLGEARQPGAYTVSGLSTISNALVASGGVKPIGSLRNVELKRAGRTVVTLDLYDLLIKGDTSRDVRLLPGDVIFIPPVGSVAAISGAVKRPAIYELKGSNTVVRELVELAGGYAVNADRSKATLNRVGAGPLREVLRIDLAQSTDLSVLMKNGDAVFVDFNLPVVAGEIELAGHVHRPGKLALQPGMKLTDLIRNVDDLKPFPDLGYVFVARLDRNSGNRQALSVDLQAAWREPASPANLALAAGDVIVAFESRKPRDELVRCLMRPTVQIVESDSPDTALPGEQRSAKERATVSDNLLESTGTRCLRTLALPKQSEQASADPQTGYPTVNITGSVNANGVYPLETDMRVSDLLRAGGGLAERAYTLKAELIRFRIDAEQVRRREILTVDLQRLLQGDVAADAIVEPYDELAVRVVPEWSTRNTVTLEGEVVFPGTYSIAPGETLRGVIERAGGLKATAFAAGAFFSRGTLRERELEQLKKAQDELRRNLEQQQREILANARPGDTASISPQQLQGLLGSTLSSAVDNPALGRLTIDLDGVLAGAVFSRADIVLQDGDRLFVPKRASEVSVIGEVFAASSHIFEPGLTADDYIEYAGGFRTTADRKSVYVVSASGRAKRAAGGLFRGGTGASIRPGDSIIVPLEIPKVRSPILETFKEVTQILYNLSLGAAAINTFRN